MARLEREYKGEKIPVGRRKHSSFWRSASGRKAADAQVVAVGKVLEYFVVSDDRAIQLAGMLKNVPCIGWAEFARRLREEQKEQKQLEFFQRLGNHKD